MTRERRVTYTMWLHSITVLVTLTFLFTDVQASPEEDIAKRGENITSPEGMLFLNCEACVTDQQRRIFCNPDGGSGDGVTYVNATDYEVVTISMSELNQEGFCWHGM